MSNEAIYNRIAMLRAERGISRRELADALGVHYQTVGYLERGEYSPSLHLALRIAAGGGRCRLAPGARALHAYSAGLGAASGAKYARTGWSRGYMLRRYGVMRNPRLALRALACEAAIIACDLAEVIGTAIALKLLFGLPLILGALITALDARQIGYCCR